MSKIHIETEESPLDDQMHDIEKPEPKRSKSEMDGAGRFSLVLFAESLVDDDIEPGFTVH